MLQCLQSPGERAAILNAVGEYEESGARARLVFLLKRVRQRIRELDEESAVQAMLAEEIALASKVPDSDVAVFLAGRFSFALGKDGDAAVHSRSQPVEPAADVALRALGSGVQSSSPLGTQRTMSGSAAPVGRRLSEGNAAGVRATLRAWLPGKAVKRPQRQK